MTQAHMARPAPRPDEGASVADLRRQLRDVVALLALPAMWRGPDRKPGEIALELSELLVHLLRLDVAYVSLRDPERGTVTEAVRPVPAGTSLEIGAAVAELPASGEVAEREVGRLGKLRLVRVVPGIDPDLWHIVAGSSRPTFPDDSERFLLRIAVEQAAIAVENLRLYLEAHRASEAKSQFMAVMSHELRTPLNAILGYADLLLLGVPKPLEPESREQIDRIRTSTHHLLNIIEEILTFSRLEAGAEQARPEPLHLRSFMHATASLVEPLSQAKKLRLRVGEIPDRVVVTDGPKLRQILLNLLSNAIKFTEAGEIELTVEASEASLDVRVRDTGMGIPREHLERIFEPFRQVEQNFTRQKGGTGLGLSVTRQLARLLGGDIRVTSQPGEGSTFTVSLPVSSPPAERSPTPGTS